jgi:thiamine biosynthesis protein ThiS
MVYIDEQPFGWRPGMTLAELIDMVDEQHFFAVVRLNGKLVARPNFSSTPVPDGSQVMLIPMIAGG